MLSSIIEGAFRSICFALDKGVYWFLEQAYNIIIELSEVNILSNSTISSFTNRIYLFIGIIMLFKVAISLINYFLNPDSFNDSKNGMGSVLKRIVVSLILIIIVPIVFNMAYELQAVILKNNILPNIILGEPSNIEYTENVVNKGGNFIAVSIFDAFVRPKNNDTKTDKIDVDNMPTIGSYASKIEDKETYDYKIPLSTIAGGLAAWILVMFCFDIGMRAVKLSFLQLIAPIPIISYVDPKKGDGIFKKWVSACTSAYLMIFIRLVVLYFIMFIIAELAYNNWQLFDAVNGGQKDVSALAYVFVILGLLLFAKEAPQLICDILGIKSMGSFTLNPMKKLGSSPFAAGVLGAAGGTVLGATANAVAAVKNGRGALGILGSTIAGGTSGGWNSAKDAAGGKGNVWSSITAGVTKSSNNRNLRRGVPDKDDPKNPNKGIPGYGIKDKVNDWWHTVSGTPYKGGTTDKLKNDIIALQQKKQNIAMQESAQRKAFSEGMTNSPNAQTLQKLFKNYDGNGNINPYDLPSRPNQKDYAGDDQGYHNAMTQYAKAMNDVAKNLEVSVSDLTAAEGEYNKYKAINETIKNLDSEARYVDKQLEKLQERKSAAKPKGTK